MAGKENQKGLVSGGLLWKTMKKFGFKVEQNGSSREFSKEGTQVDTNAMLRSLRWQMGRLKERRAKENTESGQSNGGESGHEPTPPQSKEHSPNDGVNSAATGRLPSDNNNEVQTTSTNGLESPPEKTPDKSHRNKEASNEKLPPNPVNDRGVNLTDASRTNSNALRSNNNQQVIEIDEEDELINVDEPEDCRMGVEGRTTAIIPPPRIFTFKEAMDDIRQENEIAQASRETMEFVFSHPMAPNQIRDAVIEVVEILSDSGDEGYSESLRMVTNDDDVDTPIVVSKTGEERATTKRSADGAASSLTGQNNQDGRQRGNSLRKRSAAEKNNHNVDGQNKKRKDHTLSCGGRLENSDQPSVRNSRSRDGVCSTVDQTENITQEMQGDNPNATSPNAPEDISMCRNTETLAPSSVFSDVSDDDSQTGNQFLEAVAKEKGRSSNSAVEPTVTITIQSADEPVSRIRCDTEIQETNGNPQGTDVETPSDSAYNAPETTPTNDSRTASENAESSSFHVDESVRNESGHVGKTTEYPVMSIPEPSNKSGMASALPTDLPRACSNDISGHSSENEASAEITALEEAICLILGPIPDATTEMTTNSYIETASYSATNATSESIGEKDNNVADTGISDTPESLADANESNLPLLRIRTDIFVDEDADGDGDDVITGEELNSIINETTPLTTAGDIGQELQQIATTPFSLTLADLLRDSPSESQSNIVFSNASIAADTSTASSTPVISNVHSISPTPTTAITSVPAATQALSTTVSTSPSTTSVTTVNSPSVCYASPAPTAGTPQSGAFIPSTSNDCHRMISLSDANNVTTTLAKLKVASHGQITRLNSEYLKLQQHCEANDHSQMTATINVMNNLKKCMFSFCESLDIHLDILKVNSPGLETVVESVASVQPEPELTIEELTEYFEVLMECVGFYRVCTNEKMKAVTQIMIVRVLRILSYFMYLKDPSQAEQKFNNVCSMVAARPLGQKYGNPAQRAKLCDQLWIAIRRYQGGPLHREEALMDHASCGSKSFTLRISKFKERYNKPALAQRQQQQSQSSPNSTVPNYQYQPQPATAVSSAGNQQYHIGGSAQTAQANQFTSGATTAQNITHYQNITNVQVAEQQPTAMVSHYPNPQHQYGNQGQQVQQQRASVSQAGPPRYGTMQQQQYARAQQQTGQPPQYHQRYQTNPAAEYQQRQTPLQVQQSQMEQIRLNEIRHQQQLQNSQMQNQVSVNQLIQQARNQTQNASPFQIQNQQQQHMSANNVQRYQAVAPNGNGTSSANYQTAFQLNYGTQQQANVQQQQRQVNRSAQATVPNYNPNRMVAPTNTQTQVEQDEIVFLESRPRVPSNQQQPAANSATPRTTADGRHILIHYEGVQMAEVPYVGTPDTAGSAQVRVGQRQKRRTPSTENRNSPGNRTTVPRCSPNAAISTPLNAQRHVQRAAPTSHTWSHDPGASSGLGEINLRHLLSQNSQSQPISPSQSVRTDGSAIGGQVASSQPSATEFENFTQLAQAQANTVYYPSANGEVVANSLSGIYGQVSDPS